MHLSQKEGLREMRENASLSSVRAMLGRREDREEGGKEQTAGL